MANNNWMYQGSQTQTPLFSRAYNYGYSPNPYQPNNGFVWVQGEEAAKAYPVSPNNKILLMDSENPVLYMKSADSNGRPLPIEIFDLVKRETVTVDDKIEEIQNENSNTEYVKKDEIAAIVSEAIRAEFAEQRKNRQNKNSNVKKNKGDDEE